MLDKRLLRVGIEVNGKLNVYENLAITCQGFKSGSPIQNECNITIANLDKNTRDFLETEGNPYNRIRTNKRSRIIVEAGRESTGYFVLYRGDIVSVGGTQPPDIVTSIRALTADTFKGKIVTNSSTPVTPVSSIAKQIADDMGLSLQFEATDKDIANYNYTGSAEKQVERIYYLGNYSAFIDDDKLVVIDRDKPLTNQIRKLSPSTGLIGKPEWIDNGVRVKFFVDNFTKVGTNLQLESPIYPSFNGNYKIVKLAFDVANRAQPFYFIADALRIL